MALPIVSKYRYKNLDPVRDHELIVRQMVVETCTFDFVRSIEIALIKTFAIPSIADILVNSGEFLNRTQKRYDDTDLLLSHFIEAGYSSRVGIEAIRRINRMHARHPITNEQMLYVLSTFVVEPILWMERFSIRSLNKIEREALFQFWIAVGKRMGIRELFPNLEAMLDYHERYEQSYMVPSSNNIKLYWGVLPTVARMMPFPLSEIIAPILPALMEPRLCAAFELKSGAGWLRSLVRAALVSRSALSFLLPTRPSYRTRMKRKTYPQGHEVKSLGV